MIFVKPVAIDQGNIIASTLPNNDFPVFNLATSYVVGNKVTDGTNNFECLSNTVNNPTTGVEWLDIGVINKLAMFDKKNSTKSVASNTLTFTCQLMGVVNAFSLSNISADTVKVTVHDENDSIVFDQVISLSNQGVANFYDFFFSPVSKKDTAFINNLPPYLNPKITVEITGSEIEVGTCIFGYQELIGEAEWGYKVSIDDYSSINYDVFGNYEITPRGKAKTSSFNIHLPTNLIAIMQSKLAKIQGIPCLFIADEKRDETVVFGIFETFEIVATNNIQSLCQLKIKGLV